mgnify:CR=1 FL=1
MFEKRLKELSNKIGFEQEREFYILTHKKHGREIYFQNNFKSINFMKMKFNPSARKFKKIKSLTYLLIRLGILQPFLRKIRLSDKFGDVIFVAEQIKGFDLDKKTVTSFPLDESDRKNFLKTKEFQKRISLKKFAPKTFEINKNVPFSKEELLKEYDGKNYLAPFKKLYLFYKEEGIREIQVKDHIKNLIKDHGEKKVNDDCFNLTLSKLLLSNEKVLITTIHGDLVKEHILSDKDSCVFTDWNPKKETIIGDLINFFWEEKKPLENKKVKEIIKIYPKKIRKNIIFYLLLKEISAVIRGERVGPLEKRDKRFMIYFLKNISPAE